MSERIGPCQSCGTYHQPGESFEHCPDKPRRPTDRLAEIERLHAAATRPPWFVVGHPWNPDGPAYIIAGNSDPHVGRAVCDFNIQRDEETGEPDTDDNGYADADFIVAAANFAPLAVRSIRKLMEALENADRSARRIQPWQTAGDAILDVTTGALSEVRKELGIG